MEDNKEKENGFSKWWTKTKTSVQSSMLEGHIEQHFRNENLEFQVYQFEETFSSTHYGYYELDEESLVIFGKQEFKPSSMILNSKSNKMFTITSSEETICIIKYEGQTYERPATRLFLSKDCEEVKVIKCGKKYYKYKG